MATKIRCWGDEIIDPDEIRRFDGIWEYIKKRCCRICPVRAAGQWGEAELGWPSREAHRGRKGDSALTSVYAILVQIAEHFYKSFLTGL
jgi:hypothetical protein